jgi:hypothetical protein
LEKKCLEGSKELKSYLQDKRFSPLACTPLENSWLRRWCIISFSSPDVTENNKTFAYFSKEKEFNT